MLIILIFGGLALYSSVQSSIDYMTGPGFSSEYNMVFDQQTGESVKLADFLVCDISPWDVERAQRNGISVELLSYLTHLLFPFGGNDPLFSEENKDKLADLEKKYQEVVAKYDNDVNALLDRVTRTCDETIIYCRMGMGRDLTGKECCDMNFNSSVFTTEGKCFNTAGKMDYYMGEAVKPLGMFVGVHIGQDISGVLNPTQTPFSALSSRGITLVLSDPKDHPFISSVKRAYLLQPNTISSVAVEKSVIDSSGLQDSIIHKQECAISTDQEIIMNKSPGYRLYSKENCGLSSMQRLATKSMNCSIFNLPNPDDVPNCSPGQAVTFFQHFSETHIGSEQENRDSMAADACPLDCIKEIYSARVSSHDLTVGAKKFIAMERLNTETEQNFAGMNVHYPSFDSIKIVQHGKVGLRDCKTYF